MARITIEDCVPAVPNRFELVILAARRARELAGGSDPKVPRDHDKNTIVALREIAEKGVTADELRARVIDQIAAPRLPGKSLDEEIMEDLEAVCVTEDDDDE